MDKGKLPPVLEEMKKQFGNSAEFSRDAVIAAHGGVENLRQVAVIWGKHHKISGDQEDIIISYATAVDLGYRIRNKQLL